MFGKPITFFSENISRTAPFVLTGGTETSVGADKVLTFTSTGTLTVNGSGTIQLLIVGAGGGGGLGDRFWNNPNGFPGRSGGGGKGGQVLYYASYNVSSGSYTVTVAPQTSSNSNTDASIGANTSIFGLTASGSGGANGGASKQAPNSGTISSDGLPGSEGTTNSITGTAVVYGSGAGSGAFGTDNTKSGGLGGTGAGNGGGVNFRTHTPLATAGTNYGAGGGGGGVIYQISGSSGATGQQGVVIIRYTPK